MFWRDDGIVEGEMGILVFFDLRRMRLPKEIRVMPEMERRGRTGNDFLAGFGCLIPSDWSWLIWSGVRFISLIYVFFCFD